MEQCFKQNSMVGNLKRVPGDDQSTNSTSRTTIVTTLVTTIVMPMPTKTTSNPRLTSVICISETASPLISQTPTTSMNHISLLHTPPTSSTSLPTVNISAEIGLRSSSIIGIVIGVVLFAFVLAFILSWRSRRRKTVNPTRRSVVNPTEAVESQTVQIEPLSLLPKFWFEKERNTDDGQISASVFVDKFTRLNKPNSPGVRWVADDDTRNPKQKIEPKAFFDSESFEPPPPNKMTVVNTFITDLPDELPVAVGQELNVLAEYDDGWIFCSNESGEHGMVPVECVHTKEEV